MQEPLWIATAACVLLAALAAWAERRRAARTRIDAVGWVPWSAILLASMMVGAVCAALALRG